MPKNDTTPLSNTTTSTAWVPVSTLYVGLYLISLLECQEMSRFTFCRFQSFFFFFQHIYCSNHTAPKMGLFISSHSKKVTALDNLFLFFFFPWPQWDLSFCLLLWISGHFSSCLSILQCVLNIWQNLSPPQPASSQPASLSQPVSGTLQRVFMPRDSESFHLLHNAAPPPNVVSGEEERSSQPVPFSGWETKTVRKKGERVRERRERASRKKNAVEGRTHAPLLTVEIFLRLSRFVFYFNWNF